MTHASNSGPIHHMARAICPQCQRDVAVRRGGELREHREGEGGELCAGSGLTVAQVEREIEKTIERLRQPPRTWGYV